MCVCACEKDRKSVRIDNLTQVNNAKQHLAKGKKSPLKYIKD